MKRLYLIIICGLLFSSIFAKDDDVFGSILFYAGKENVEKTRLSQNIGSDITFKYFYSDSEFFNVYYPSEYKIIKKVKPGTYHINKIERVVRFGDPVILNDFDITITVKPNETMIFPLRVYYEIKENNDLRASWKPIIRSMSEDDYKACNEYLKK